MSGGYLITEEACNAQDVGAVTATTLGTVVTASGSANTKGSYAQLIASTVSDCTMLDICVYLDATGFGGGTCIASVDIAIGAAASEVVIVPNIVVAPPYLSAAGVRILVPISIPSGTRISARAQQAGGGATVVNVSITLLDSGFGMLGSCGGVETVGFQSASTIGATVTPNATAHVKGSYAQLTASTSRDYVGFFACFDQQVNSAGVKYLIDIAIGAAASEVVIIPNRFWNAGQSDCAATPFFPIQIPSGTRIAARCQAGSASASAVGVTLYGVF